MDGHTYIYIMRCGEFAKIGRSHDPKHRLRQLRTGAPGPLSIEWTFKVPRDRAGQIEAAAHGLLGGKRHYGEWFKISGLTARRAVAEVIRQIAPDPELSLEEYRSIYRKAMSGEVYLDLSD